MAVLVQKIALAVKKTTNADGINIGMNNGTAAGQVVPHAHIHIIPRFSDDGYKLWQSNHGYKDGREKELADKISKQIVL